MKNIIVIGLAAAALAGCRSVTVKNYGQEVVDVNGVQTVISKGWYVSHWQHWMITKADAVEANVKPGEIEFKLNGLDEMPDGEGLAKVVTASLSSAAELGQIRQCGRRHGEGVRLMQGRQLHDHGRRDYLHGRFVLLYGGMILGPPDLPTSTPFRRASGR